MTVSPQGTTPLTGDNLPPAPPQAPADGDTTPPVTPPTSNDEGEGEGDEGKEQEPTIEALQAELARVQAALHKANREAAQRRIALKKQQQQSTKKGGSEGEGDGEGADERDAEIARLREELAIRDRNARHAAQRQQIIAAATAAKFLHPEDAVALAGIELDDDEDELDEAMVRTAVKALAAKRPELIRREQPPNLDGRKGSSSGATLNIDEEAIMRDFGIH